MDEQESNEIGLVEALAVAKGEATAPTDDGDTKLLGFLFRQGECNAEISESVISVRYSWLPYPPRPSTYFCSLAPGLVRQLMELGDLQQIDDEVTYKVGPGRTGTGDYAFKFKRKWVRIQCEENRIVIRVRDKRKDLDNERPKSFGKIYLCERCNGELMTPLAKQCLHCGHDWH